MAGLDPATHSIPQGALRYRVDPRVKPGDDAVGGVTW